MKKMPGAATILLVIMAIIALASWVIPSVTFETLTNAETGYQMIDQSSVVIHSPNRIYPWQLPRMLIDGVEKVFSTIVLICVCNGAFAVLNGSGAFSKLIGRLCAIFRNKENHLILLILISFSIVGIIVPPHCFIAFVPMAIALAQRTGYDPVVGLAMVLFGATTASISGPLAGVTAMCQERVGLPVYSGLTVRLAVFVIFLVIDSLYLNHYAKQVRADLSKSLLSVEQYGMAEYAESVEDSEDSLNKRQIIALSGIVAVFVLIVAGSAGLHFQTADISAIFLAFALLAGSVLGFDLDETIRHFGSGLSRTVPTVIILSFGGAVTVLLEQAGIMTTLLYYTSSFFGILPDFLVPAGFLLLVSLCNVILPSGMAKGVVLLPLLGPAVQMQGMTLQTSVLAYNMGDSFSNYLLPYDATTASYLENGKVPFQIWVKFVWKLFLIWNIAGIICLTILKYTGYGPF